jgi:hypothetical protein
MVWVTWQNVRVDRMACAWLIQRFIDPEAEFVFLPEGETAIPEAAAGFDIPGSQYSHRRGRASFHALLTEHGLEDDVLHLIARIVDEADVVQDEVLEAVAPGLDLICRGVSMTSPSDAVSLARGALIYDGLYAALSDGKP